MNYREMLHAIDSPKALEILGVQADTNGAYVRSPCPAKCETTAIIETCGDNRQAVSTFGLPYLSAKRMELLNQCEIITVFRDDAEIVRQAAAHYKGFVRFIS